jgi:hypothetical protein
MSKPFYGPCAASYTVKWSDSRGCSCYGTLEAAKSDLTYFRTAGREAIPTVTITLLCPVPGCDGWGNVKVRGRAGMYRDTPCKCHVKAYEATTELE